MNNIFVHPHVRGLIFDCDGTLVDSMPLHMTAWKETLSNFGAVYDERFLYALKGMKELEIVSLYNDKFRTELEPSKVVEAKQKIMKERLHNVLPVKPVVDIAKQFYKVLPLAIASGSARDIVLAELETVGILHLFDAVVTADDVLKPKPDPAVFLEAAKRINVEPKLCQVFEDGDPGLEAAIKAGMMAIDVRAFSEKNF